MNQAEKENSGQEVIIFGGGPAGLTAAYQLLKAGIKSIVLEKDNKVGGLSKTVSYKGYNFDMGGHRFFTKFRQVEKLWEETLGDEFIKRKRLSRIYYKKTFFYYPLRPINAFIGLGPINSLLVILSYIKIKFFPLKEQRTFEEWVINHFGKRLYYIFFKPYTEKVWGIQCNEIMSDWAAQRIQGLSLFNVIKNALIHQKNIKTLIKTFSYPKRGPGMMWDFFAKKINESDSYVELNSEVTKIFWSQDQISYVEVKNSEGMLRNIKGSHFISSMPLKELVESLSPAAPLEVLAAAGTLKYRDFLTVALIIDKENLFPDNWIYVHDPIVKVARIQNYKNWSPFMVPDITKTCLGLEYFCFRGDELWSMSDSDLIELGTKELNTIGLLKGGRVEDGKVVRVRQAYPVYDGEYKKAVNTIFDFLKNFSNLQVIGRNGMHRYNNMDHSMLTAMLAVNNILGANHNLQNINEEKVYHEEIR